MATRKETLDPILDAIPGASFRSMFGEYALYLDGKVVAFVCDDTLFLKNLPEVAAIVVGAELAPAYPGSKMYLVGDPWLDDPETLERAVRATANALPAPKPKKPKIPKGPK